ncbi:S8 family serine peptidase [Chitinophaga solisilvae]|uniref:S8 family serine peptidase n=1 Tax=Chitinophaga solisilvae TaxID=1233460 RepID=UPI00136F5BAE|nr:S8 family serine peptidase [Chitinophaga solisilvae]
MKTITSKSLTVAAFALLHCQLGAAQKKPSADSMIIRYATDTLRDKRSASQVLVRFKDIPDDKTLGRYGLVKPLSSHHYILRQLPPDSSIKYAYLAGPNSKATTLLLQQLEKISNRDSITLQITYDATYTPSPLARVIQDISTYHAAVVKLKKQDWPAFIATPAIIIADAFRKPSTEIIINTINPFVNRINTAQYKYPAVRGKSITVSVKEDRFDTMDIDLKDRIIPNPLTSNILTTHATTMATLIAGGGNTGNFGLGVVPEAHLSSMNYNSIFPDDNAYYQRYGITVQNHSYGSGNDNRYGSEAAAFDQQIAAADTLVHVFSSGNSGAETAGTGRYKGINGYANMTGNYKHAKNVLIAGGTDGGGTVIMLASKGPAYDGRIKPEIVAYGQDGTSGASALTSGVVALMQDAYRQQKGVAPHSALVKAVIINSAIRPKGITPGYDRGFGSIHAENVLTTLTDNRYREGTLTSNNQTFFDINVPAGTTQVKVTISWNDPPAAAEAVKALINDLDISAVTADNKTWLPWVLNGFPAADSIRKPAIRAVDTLNNNEQISIDNPPAGNLRIIVRAKQLGTASQAFALAWSLSREPYFAWQNPLQGSSFAAGEQTQLQWETSYTSNGDLYYSTDSLNWRPLTQQILLNYPVLWEIPDTLFSKVWLKLTLPDTSFISPAAHVSPKLRLRTGFNCADTALISWARIPAAAAYNIYYMNAGKMALYKQVRDTFLFIPKKTISTPYFSIAPVAPAGWEGARSYTTDYSLQGVACYVETLLADPSGNNQVLLSLTLGSTYLLKNIYWERKSLNGWTTIGTQAVNGNLSFNFTDTQPYEGIVLYRVRLETGDGRNFYSDYVSVSILLENDILMFPNPVTSQLYILDKELRTRQLRITDMGGRTLMIRTISDMQETIPVSWLPAGIYNCSIYLNGQKIFSRQMVKQ